MKGDDILLDTNAFIYFLEGRARIAEHILLAETIGYSVITEIERLSAPNLTPEDTAAIREFLARCQRVDLTPDMVERTIQLRSRERIKTPDAMVAASALILDVPLVTAGLKTITDILN